MNVEELADKVDVLARLYTDRPKETYPTAREQGGASEGYGPKRMVIELIDDALDYLPRSSGV